MFIYKNIKYKLLLLCKAQKCFVVKLKPRLTTGTCDNFKIRKMPFPPKQSKYISTVFILKLKQTMNKQPKHKKKLNRNCYDFVFGKLF